MPQTRAVFLDYQGRIRPGAAVLQFLREWGAKSKDEKRRWVDARVDVSLQEGLIRAPEDELNNALQQIRDIPVDQNPDIHAYMAACATAKQQYRRLRRMYFELERRWLALHQQEATQPGQSMDSIHHAHLSAQSARHKAEMTGTNIEDVRQSRNTPPVPPDALGRRRMAARLFEGDDTELVKARSRSTTREEDAEDDHISLLRPEQSFWQAIPIGGGQTAGYLWLLNDENDNIIDRVFRKDTTLNELTWTSPWVWEGDVRDPSTKTPYELSCHNALLLAPGVRNVVGMRGGLHRRLINNDSCTYKLYTEWSQHRDLRMLITEYRTRAETDAAAHVPEGMVWYVAEALSECGHAMAGGMAPRPSIPDDETSGDADDSDEDERTSPARPGDDSNVPHRVWDEIVHRDLKPANVFLGAPDDHRYTRYPKPVLGDFGLAMRTNADDPNNPRWYNKWGGTEGFRAPEQLRWIEADTHRPIDEWRLGTKTNAYGVGVILWCLVTLVDVPDQPEWFGDGDNDETLALNPARYPSLGQYSQQLLDLIGDCLSFRPEDRPTFRRILDTILFETDDRAVVGPNRAMGMRNGTASLATAIREATFLYPDEYRLELTV